MGLLNAMKEDNNFGYTENGSIKRNTSLNKILDLFALGGAYRNRTDKEVEELFGDAYRQNKELALKCLFYLRDCNDKKNNGQGERRFFRVAYSWLVRNDRPVAIRNLAIIPEFGRWDDLIDIAYRTRDDIAYKTRDDYFVTHAFAFIANQLALDDECKTPSLLGKWMPSENASNPETKAKAKWCMRLLGMTPRDYRKLLSRLRKKIQPVEQLMSQNRWDEIEFDKIPSLAGLKYRNAFAVKEVTAARYKAFMANKTTKVNAAVLNPVDIVSKIIGKYYYGTKDIPQVERDALCKYWDNLKDYYQGREENAIAIVDTSGSMWGQPLCAAVGMGAYVASKSHGPFANHFITFSSDPELVEFEGDDIVDKIQRCAHENRWGNSTNVKAAMDLILDSAIKHKLPQSDLPARLYIFSDMEFDRCITAEHHNRYYSSCLGRNEINTLFEDIQREWAAAGYEMPQVTFWNLDARQNNIPAIGPKFNYISGFSMGQMESVMSGKTAIDMMLEVLNKERYSVVKVVDNTGATSMACTEN